MELELELAGIELEAEVKGSRGWITIVGLALLAACVVRELRLPAEERRWHGKLLGFLPYELRLPTAERLRDRLWNTSDTRVLVPTVFGVGWSINFAQLWTRAGLAEAA